MTGPSDNPLRPVPLDVTAATVRVSKITYDGAPAGMQLLDTLAPDGLVVDDSGPTEGWTFPTSGSMQFEVTFTDVSIDLVRWLIGDIPNLRRPRMKYRARRRHRGYTRTGRRR